MKGPPWLQAAAYAASTIEVMGHPRPRQGPRRAKWAQRSREGAWSMHEAGGSRVRPSPRPARIGCATRRGSRF